MGRHYLIGGERVRLRSLIKLDARERGRLRAERVVLVERDVEWPIHCGEPLFIDARVDLGGTPWWGPGPYLKVPNIRRHADGDFTAINRVFCPWGYPPDRIRLAHRQDRVELRVVELVHRGVGGWRWALTLVPVDPVPDSDALR